VAEAAARSASEEAAGLHAEEERAPMDDIEALRFWHYTLAAYLPSILSDGMIKRARIGTRVTNSRPAVWFSTRPTWEPTATKGILDRQAGERRPAIMTEMLQHGGPLCRLEVPVVVARHTWTQHRQRYEVPRIADTLEANAREQGSDPSEWRVSYHDVPLSKVLCIEVSSDGETWRLAWDPNNGVAPEFRREGV
jgi:hypothetical protein